MTIDKRVEDEKKLFKYSSFRWGPCVVKFKIEEEFRLRRLEEAEQSHKDHATKLAGVLSKQVAFRNPDLFFKDFDYYFEVWNYSLAQWNGEMVRYEDGKKIVMKETPDKYLMEALWCNWQTAGDFNPPHDHGGDLTWVIYLKIPKELDEENKKYKGRSAGPGGITFVYGENADRKCITHHSVYPEEGDMIMFPAWLKHWVYPFKSDCTRISVSGNASTSIKLHKIKPIADKMKKDDK